MTTHPSLDELIRQGVRSAGTSESLFNPNSALSRQFDAEYDRWMNWRAARGDAFALSLGYRGAP
jgi:hypothetical protein